LPLWTAAGAQCVAGQAPAEKVTLVAPFMPESTLAYQLGAGRLEPLRKLRKTGGIRVSLEHFGISGLVLFAQDEVLEEAALRRAAASGRRQVELECALAEDKYRQVRQIVDPLGPSLPAAAGASRRLADAANSLASCRRDLAAGAQAAAIAEARQTMLPLRLLEQACWLVSVKGLPTPLASPGAAGFATLPWHWGLMRRLADCRPGPNRLPGGDFEQLDVMRQTGWRHYQHPAPGIQAAADVVPEAAHAGRFGLRLTARANDPAHPPAIIETPPLWITSPPVPVQAGQLIRIHGWVNIPLPITGSVDALEVVDSLGGDDLAERIDKTAGWREFTLYRAALQGGEATVTFILSGLGEVRLDDVTIQVMEPVAANHARRFASGPGAIRMEGSEPAPGRGYGTPTPATSGETPRTRAQAPGPGRQSGLVLAGAGAPDAGAGERLGHGIAGQSVLRSPDRPDREGDQG
jgi:hypothetical protein